MPKLPPRVSLFVDQHFVMFAVPDPALEGDAAITARYIWPQWIPLCKRYHHFTNMVSSLDPDISLSDPHKDGKWRSKASTYFNLPLLQVLNVDSSAKFEIVQDAPAKDSLNIHVNELVAGSKSELLALLLQRKVSMKSAQFLLEAATDAITVSQVFKALPGEGKQTHPRRVEGKHGRAAAAAPAGAPRPAAAAAARATEDEETTDGNQEDDEDEEDNAADAARPQNARNQRIVELDDAGNWKLATDQSLLSTRRVRQSGGLVVNVPPELARDQAFYMQVGKGRAGSALGKASRSRYDAAIVYQGLRWDQREIDMPGAKLRTLFRINLEKSKGKPLFRAFEDMSALDDTFELFWLECMSPTLRGAWNNVMMDLCRETMGSSRTLMSSPFYMLLNHPESEIDYESPTHIRPNVLFEQPLMLEHCANLLKDVDAFRVLFYGMRGNHKSSLDTHREFAMRSRKRLVKFGLKWEKTATEKRKRKNREEEEQNEASVGVGRGRFSVL